MPGKDDYVAILEHPPQSASASRGRMRRPSRCRTAGRFVPTRQQQQRQGMRV